MNIKDYSVSKIVSQIKLSVERQFSSIAVVGEVSNLTCSTSGHWYFSLSDQAATLSTAMFKGKALREPYLRKLKNGDKVVCSGSIGLYAKRGSLQLICDKISPLGKGSLKEQFEKLKAKLAAEGLFDLTHKKEIPRYPKKIALVTAPGAAALQDFLKIYMSRATHGNLELFPCLVQGIKAPASIRKALDEIESRQDEFDLVVVMRGGGSLEDLWAFNDEALVRDVFRLPLPVISGVGHEVDFTLIDYVSDLRVETPSAAAHKVTEGMRETVESLLDCHKRLLRFSDSSSRLLEEKERRLSYKYMKSLIEKKYQEVLESFDYHRYEERLPASISLDEKVRELDELESQLSQKMTLSLEKMDHRLKLVDQSMRALDPSMVLKRGYSYIKDKKQVVESLKDFQRSKGPYHIYFHDGEALVTKEENNVV